MHKTYLPSLLLRPYASSVTATVLCADALTGHTFTKVKSFQSIIKRPGAQKLDRVPQKCTRGEMQLERVSAADVSVTGRGLPTIITPEALESHGGTWHSLSTN